MVSRLGSVVFDTPQTSFGRACWHPVLALYGLFVIYLFNLRTTAQLRIQRVDQAEVSRLVHRLDVENTDPHIAEGGGRSRSYNGMIEEPVHVNAVPNIGLRSDVVGRLRPR